MIFHGKKLKKIENLLKKNQKFQNRKIFKNVENFKNFKNFRDFRNMEKKNQNFKNALFMRVWGFYAERHLKIYLPCGGISP